MTDLKILFSKLRSGGMKVGMATADNEQSAMHLVNKLDLSHQFDFIGSNDGTMKPKPHKDMCLKFCSMYGFKPYEVAVVGDSYNDMIFARNSGALAVGVLSGVSSKINLKDVADIILPSVESLLEEEVISDLLRDKYGVRELWTA
jgi:phosphoglycolate phosphatase-like HAD superfamily hydrolase